MDSERMESETETTFLLTKALPVGFSFYNMGTVEMLSADSAQTQAGEVSDFPEPGLSIGYQFVGELRGLILIMIPDGLNLSMYMELGNILASRIATYLSNEEGIDVMISPPKVMTEQNLQHFTRIESEVSRTYYHRYGNCVVRLKC